MFPRGVGELYKIFAEADTFAGISLDSSVAVDWAARALQPHVTVQGNLDPIMLVTGGAAMLDEATRILGTLGGGPFIFNLGHGIVPQTPPEHVAALAELINGWHA
jgi:uroporphyrinogen decarboxylase